MKSQSGDGPGPAVLCFRRILMLAQHLRYHMDQRLAADGLTTQQAVLLGVIEQLEEPPSLNQAAEVMATSHQNVKQLVDSLERKGFLEVQPDPADRRVRRLAATAKSRQYWRSRDASDFEAIERQFACLSRREIETLEALLEKLARSMHAGRGGGPGGAPG